ncbi:hypothetical protein POM88_032876 [Heracleum sosnowskyi]|uniref:Uncharacterized protein n=1 Tax=Heracleum sosnowskyi TaxID=360622 RepID=A0AAD8MLQ1_9APIA|nr:hypothetical protein POM88_032876 [Heracleum sosnowskyi]
MRSIIPRLDLEDGTSNEAFAKYFGDLKESITKFDDEPIRERNLRVFECIKADKTILPKDLLRFVPLFYEDFEVTLLFHAEHSYFWGSLTKEVESIDKPIRRCYLLFEDTEVDVLPIQNCLNIHYKNSENIIKVTGMGENYFNMQKKADSDRSQVVLGRASLISAVKFLSTTDEDSIMENLDTMAKHCIVITQMFCESFRVRELGDMGKSRFVQGFTVPERLCIEEHGWSIASRSLQSKAQKHGHVLYVADVRDEALKEDYLHKTYDALLPCVAEVKPTKVEFKKVLTTKFMGASLGKFVKSRQVKFGSTEKVTAMIHVFEEHVVLQYNHQNFPEVRVDAEASSSTLFTKIVRQPIKELKGRSFVVFMRNEHVLSTASFNVIVDKNDNFPSLDSFEVSPKDFLTSVETPKFYPTLSSRDGMRCTTHSHKTLYANKTFKDAKTAIEGLFDMEALDNQMTDPKAASKNERRRKRGEKNKKLIYGRYLNTFEVFIEVSFNSKEVEVQPDDSNEIKKRVVVDDTELAVHCKGRACHDAICAILKDWEEI